MTNKNSDLRAFVAASQAQSSGGSARLLSAGAAAVIGLGVAYAYTSGKFDKKPAAAVVAQPATQVASTTAPAKPAAQPEARIDPRDARDAFNRAIMVTMRDSTRLLQFLDYYATFQSTQEVNTAMNGGFTPPSKSFTPPSSSVTAPSRNDPRSRPNPGPAHQQSMARVINPNDTVAYCVDQTPALNPRNKARRNINKPEEEAAFIFNSLSDVLHCVMTRGMSQHCDKATRDRLITQIGFYNTLRDDTLAGVSKNPELLRLVTAGFDLGVHHEIKKAFRAIGQRGTLKTGDFGYFPSSFVTDALGDFKDVKPACKA